MASQLRIYKIKPGQMENWLSFFRNKVVPMHSRFDIPVRIGWINHAESEFIWVRDFPGSSSIEEQERRYVTSEERQQVIGDEAKQYIESAVIRVVDLLYEKT